jgi:hypothetical protein
MTFPGRLTETPEPATAPVRDAERAEAMHADEPAPGMLELDPLSPIPAHHRRWFWPAHGAG